jgi:hypothetical protein
MQRSVLKTNPWLWAGWFALVAVLMPLAGAHAAIIDSTTRNGGFEDATVAPWVPFVPMITKSSLSRGSTPGFAAAGNGYMRIDVPVDSTGLADGGMDQVLSLNPANGRQLLFTWKARNAETDGFKLVGVSGSSVVTMQLLNFPALRSDIWQDYSVKVTMRDTWSGEPFDLGIAFNRRFASGTPYSVGTLYSAFVDQVSLSYVPEPACAFGVVIANCLILLRRR